MNRKFNSPGAFRASLMQRLTTQAFNTKTNLQDLMRQVSFDRFLCRIFKGKDTPWVLKGGYSLELQFESSRATKDIDLVLREQALKKAPLDEKLEYLKKVLVTFTRLEIDDFFTFHLIDATKVLTTPQYGGVRFLLESQIASRQFVRFHVDISIGDISSNPRTTLLKGGNWLEFASIPPLEYVSLAQEEIFAEKLHAYTLPRLKENSREKDLVDMVMLINEGNMDPLILINSIDQVFRRRNTHPIPSELNLPPISWNKSFSSLSERVGHTLDLNVYFSALQEYLVKHKILKK